MQDIQVSHKQPAKLQLPQPISIAGWILLDQALVLIEPVLKLLHHQVLPIVLHTYLIAHTMELNV